MAGNLLTHFTNVHGWKIANYLPSFFTILKTKRKLQNFEILSATSDGGQKSPTTKTRWMFKMENFLIVT